MNSAITKKSSQISKNLWNFKSQILKNLWNNHSAYYINMDMNQIKLLQSGRCPNNIVIVTDERDELEIHLNEFDARIQVLKISTVQLQNAFGFIQQHPNYGKGTAFIFSCGIHSLLIKVPYQDCLQHCCSIPQTILTLPENTDDSTFLMRAAIELNMNILSSTPNDIALFCGLIPIDINSYNKFICKNRPCLWNHISFEVPLCNFTGFKNYIATIELYNNFIKVHAQDLNYTAWDLEAPFFSSNSGKKKKRTFLSMKMQPNGYLIPESESIIRAHKVKALTLNLLTFLTTTTSNTFITQQEISSTKLCSITKFEQIVIISDERYMPWLKGLQNFKHVTFHLYQNTLKIDELKNYVTANQNHSTNQVVLYLLVIGIYSIVESVKSDLCSQSKCTMSNYLHILKVSKENLSEGRGITVKNLINNVNMVLQNIQTILSSNSRIAVLPPLPISLIPYLNNHTQLHYKQASFPEYLITDVKFEWLYGSWMVELFKCSIFSLKSCYVYRDELFQKMNCNKYNALKTMNCDENDDPSYTVWMEGIIDLILSVLNNSEKIENISLPIQILPQEEVIEIDSSLKTDTNSKNLSTVASMSDQFSKVATDSDKFDHLVFIGHTTSQKLLPSLDPCTYSYWSLSNCHGNNLAINIQSLFSKHFHKVLFIFIGDLSIFLNEKKNNKCLVNRCETQVKYFNTDLLTIELNSAMDSVKSLISSLKKLCKIKFNIIMAPLIPRNCVYIPNILSEQQQHIQMHAYLKDQYANFFKGDSTLKDLEAILTKFENKWQIFPSIINAELCNNEDDTKLLLNILLEYTSKVVNTYNWKKLVGTKHIRENEVLQSEWKSCMLFLAINALRTLPDSELFKIVDRNYSLCHSSNVNNSEKKKPSSHKLPLQTNEGKVPLNSPSHSRKTVISSSNDTKSRSDSAEKVNSKVKEGPKSSQHKDIDQVQTTCANRDSECVFKFLHRLDMSRKKIKKLSSCAATTMFKHVFIVGKKELVSPLSYCNIKSTIISYNLANIEESDLECLLNKFGELPDKSLCCLVFDFSLITKKLPFASACVKYVCKKPLTYTSLLLEKNIKDSEKAMSNKLENVMTFIQKLSLHIPVLVLPLSPARICGSESNDSSNFHKISHSLFDRGFDIIHGDLNLWKMCINSLTLAWNNILEVNHEDYDSSEFISCYVKSKSIILHILSNAEDFSANWIEPDIWKSFVETLLLSLVPSKHQKSGYIGNIAGEDKTSMAVKNFSLSIPTEFFEELFMFLDPNATITKMEGKYIVKDIEVEKALVLVRKLNNCKIGDSLLISYLMEMKENVINLKFSYLKLYISSIYDILYAKWKPHIIQNLIQKINEVPDIVTLKTSQCQEGDACKGVKFCFHYHSGQDRRRNPLKHDYSNDICLKSKKSDGSGVCKVGVHCNLSHNVYELNFHPLKYKIEPCPSQASTEECSILCRFFHKFSHEVFFTPAWEDLLLFGCQYSLKFFTGAIRSVFKLGKMNLDKTRIILISSSEEFLDIVIKSSAELIKAFGLSVLLLGENHGNIESYQIIAGTFKTFCSLSLDKVFKKVRGAMVVDAAECMLNDGKLKTTMEKIGTDYGGLFNKVYVCSTFNLNHVDSISKIVGCKLKALYDPAVDVCDDKYQEKSIRSPSPFDIGNKYIKAEFIPKEEARSRSNSKRVCSRSNSPSRSISKLNNCNRKSRSQSLSNDEKPRSQSSHDSKSKLQLKKKTKISCSRSKSNERKSSSRYNSHDRTSKSKSCKKSRSPYRNKDRKSSYHSKRNDRKTRSRSRSKYRESVAQSNSRDKLSKSEAKNKIRKSRSQSRSKTKKARSRSKSSSAELRFQSDNHDRKLKNISKNNRMKSSSQSRSTDKVSMSASKNHNMKLKLESKSFTDISKMQPKQKIQSQSNSPDEKFISNTIECDKKPNSRSRSKSIVDININKSLADHSSPTPSYSQNIYESLNIVPTERIVSIDNFQFKTEHQPASSTSYDPFSDDYYSREFELQSTSNVIVENLKPVSNIVQISVNADAPYTKYSQDAYKRQQPVDSKICIDNFKSLSETPLVLDQQTKYSLDDCNSKLNLQPTASSVKNPPHANSKIGIRDVKCPTAIPCSSAKRSRSKSLSPVSRQGIGLQKPKFNKIKLSETEQLNSECHNMKENKNHLTKELEKEPCELCVELGSKLYAEYLHTLEKIKIRFQEEFNVYKDVPELHPNYKQYFETFDSMYVKKHGNSDEKQKEHVWNLFWKRKFDDIRQDEWKATEQNLIKEFKTRAPIQRTSSPTLQIPPLNKAFDNPFSFKEALDLMEGISDDVGMFGPGLKMIIKSCRDNGTTTKEAYGVIASSDSVIILNMVVDKIKSMCQSASGNSLYLYKKAIDWIPKLLEEAKIGPSMLETLDLNALARASAGKSAEFTLTLIRTALAYEGITNPSNKMINELFMKVCQISLQ